MSSLYEIEHSRGLHEIYSPPGCIECYPHGAPVALQPRERIEPVAAAPAIREVNNLASALQKIVERCVVDQPDDGIDSEHETPDGNPWCDTCRGARQVAIREARKATRYIPCPECSIAPWRVQQRITKLLGELPPMFVPWRLETFPVTTGLQRMGIDLLRAWIEDPGQPWLYLHGPTGRGKTGLAVGLLYELASRGQSTALKVTPDLLGVIKDTFGSADGESERSILDALVSVDCFCLDDLGSEYHKGTEDWAAEKVFQLIGGRHDALKRTIITSNYDFEQLQDRLGHPRTVRRIVELCGKRWVLDTRQWPHLGMAKT